jgi:transcriptional regulator with XRE-family HTH domain
MKERILEFLRKENKTSAQFAEEIHVQPSGISHILSGRNKPSLDFVIKMLEKYTFLSTEWLVFGRGSMYKEPKMADLFSDIDIPQSGKPKDISPETAGKLHFESTQREDIQETIQEKSYPDHSEAVKIVWFYTDASFEEFYPRKPA